MRVAILCGGMGTRMGEETQIRPKPMVEIGGRPMLWHIMKMFAGHGFTDFALALGYKGDAIKDFFLHYKARTSDVTAHLGSGELTYSNSTSEDWIVRMIDTGEATMTGGRLRRLEHVLREGGTFMATYGDGVADIDLAALVAFHKQQGRLATVTAVRPSARFGELLLDGSSRVRQFKEKPHTEGGWINGGFFVFEPEVFRYIPDDMTVLEEEPLETLAREGELVAYRHESFWQCMDTPRDRLLLETLWTAGTAPWIPRAQANVGAVRQAGASA
jgi:glucose-1-phosphate cytidylyltransferase